MTKTYNIKKACLQQAFLISGFLIFFLKFYQAIHTQATIIQLAYILHFINGKLHLAALTFGVRVGFAFKSGAATLALYNFVLLKDY